MLEAKLRGLIRSLPDGDEMATALDVHDAPGSVGGIVASGPHAGRGFLLLGSEASERESAGIEPVRSLGPAMIWADQRAVASIELLADNEAAPGLARRASYFQDTAHSRNTAHSQETGASVTVWQIDGVSLTSAAVGEPTPVPTLSDAELAFAEVITGAGARAIDDHGRLVAEVRGLEVARVTVTDEGPILEVGVGQADRELQQLVHGGLEPEVALERAITMVLQHRQADMPLHPLNRLARERWLRSSILDMPGQVDLVEVRPVPPLRPRSTLLGTVPSAAVGSTAAGSPVVVVASVGIDVDLIPEAADYRAREEPDAELLVVVPAADIHPALGRQLGHLEAARFVTIAPPWA